MELCREKEISSFACDIRVHFIYSIFIKLLFRNFFRDGFDISVQLLSGSRMIILFKNGLVPFRVLRDKHKASKRRNFWSSFFNFFTLSKCLNVNQLSLCLLSLFNSIWISVYLEAHFQDSHFHTWIFFEYIFYNLT